MNHKPNGLREQTMNIRFNRRHFLRGTGTLIALPALESIGFRRSASAAEAAPATTPKRVVFLGFGFGVTQETWFPNIEQTEADYDLPEGLKPLARHKDDFTVVQGCSNQFSNEAHWGSTFWLTGANRFAVPGQNMSNSISADQVAARELGQDTRFSSIQLNSTDGSSSGHGPGLSLAWDLRGKPVAGFNDPVQVFHKLFSADDLPLEQRQAAIAENRSVLDAVLTEARRVQRGLTKTDKDKLEEYFQGIRDIETRLSKDEAWLEIPKARSPIDEPEPGLKGREEVEVMYDLIVAALQTDSTRVMTYRMPGQSLLRVRSGPRAPSRDVLSRTSLLRLSLLRLSLLRLSLLRLSLLRLSLLRLSLLRLSLLRLSLLRLSLLRPTSLLRLSLLRLFDSNFPGNFLWT